MLWTIFFLPMLKNIIVCLLAIFAFSQCCEYQRIQQLDSFCVHFSSDSTSSIKRGNFWVIDDNSNQEIYRSDNDFLSQIHPDYNNCWDINKNLTSIDISDFDVFMELTTLNNNAEVEYSKISFEYTTFIHDDFLDNTCQWRSFSRTVTRNRFTHGDNSPCWLRNFKTTCDGSYDDAANQNLYSRLQIAKNECRKVQFNMNRYACSTGGLTQFVDCLDKRC